MAEELSSWEVDMRRWAAETAHGDLDHAQRLLDFVLGRSDQTPKERILGALADAGIK